MSDPLMTEPDVSLVRRPWVTPRVILGNAEELTAKTGSAVEVDSSVGPTS